MSQLHVSQRPNTATRTSIVLQGLLFVVVIAGVLISWRVWEIRRFYHRRDEGSHLISSLEIQRPSTISFKRWNAAVETVRTAWGNTVFAPGDVQIRDVQASLKRMDVLINDLNSPPKDKLIVLLKSFAELRPAKRLYIEGQNTQLQSVLGEPSQSK